MVFSALVMRCSWNNSLTFLTEKCLRPIPEKWPETPNAFWTLRSEVVVFFDFDNWCKHNSGILFWTIWYCQMTPSLGTRVSVTPTKAYQAGLWRHQNIISFAFLLFIMTCNSCINIVMWFEGVWITHSEAQLINMR